jgi:hypothetical protein
MALVESNCGRRLRVAAPGAREVVNSLEGQDTNFDSY